MNDPNNIKNQFDCEDDLQTVPDDADAVTELELEELELVAGAGDGTAVGLGRD